MRILGIHGIGHADAQTTVAELSEYGAFIREFTSAVRAAKKAGKTVDQFVKEWKTPAKYTGYNAPDPANAEQVRTAEARVRADAQVIWDETK